VSTRSKTVQSQNQLMGDDARLVEVILFLENEPVSLDRLSKMTGLKAERVEKALSEIKEVYAQHMHGLDLTESHGSYHFLPSGDLHERLRSCYGRRVDRRLSRAAMETLSIVAYSQPITRREIENIRGVNSDSIIRLLREREYIKVIGRKDVVGHPCLYGTSRKFLFEFNLESISALPKLSEIDRERFEDEVQQERVEA
jgi:segregation and condensation protein B